jgi:rare lipoprotein A
MGFVISCSTSKEFSEYENVSGYLIESGVASWYGPNFHGKKTANGERFDQNELTAAHRTLPFNSILRVINSSNGNSVIVRINDRGPYAKDRIIDLSKKAAEKIDIVRNGTGNVKLFLLTNISKLPANLKIPHYTVQVGSYTNENDAIRVSSKIDDSRIVKANINGNSVYRIFV